LDVSNWHVADEPDVRGDGSFAEKQISGLGARLLYEQSDGGAARWWVVTPNCFRDRRVARELTRLLPKLLTHNTDDRY
jgi:hypothetical protein